MKKVIFIFLILISCLCLAVVSCAVKEESSTSSSSTDGSASGYMKIGNMLMVWGDTSSSANFPISFAATPTVTATVTGVNNSSTDRVTIESVTTSSVTLGLSSGETANYIAVGKWQ
jgi:hypothetical protein